MYWLLLIPALWWLYRYRPTPAFVPTYDQLYGLNLPSLPETEENLKRWVVEEVTPDGVVVLGLEGEVFTYYAPRPVQYKYLETVARKYCIVYDCRERYVNIYRELLKNLPKKEEAPDQVFAAFKPYNKRRPTITKDRCNVYKWLGKSPELTLATKEEVSSDLSYADFKHLTETESEKKEEVVI
jgi:hypothetical protein